MSKEIELTVTRADEDYDLTLVYECARYYPARMPDMINPGEPASGGDVTRLEAWYGGQRWELTEAETRKAIDAIYAHEGREYYRDWAGPDKPGTWRQGYR